MMKNYETSLLLIVIGIIISILALKFRELLPPIPGKFMDLVMLAGFFLILYGVMNLIYGRKR